MDKCTKPNWQRSALLTIDVQEDFSRQHAPAYISKTDEIIPPVAQLVRYYRKRNWPIIHVIRLYQSDGSNVDLCRRTMIEQDKQIVAPESKGAELVHELKPDRSIQLDSELLLSGNLQQIGENEWILYKPRWGAFYETCLEKKLRKLNANTVVVSGCNFPNCPRTTIYEASERDFRVALVKDGVSGSYKRAEKELENIGVGLYKTEDIIELCTQTNR